MRVRLAVATLINSVFINVQANMAAGALPINMGILFTNRKLSSIHSESVPRTRSKAKYIQVSNAFQIIIFVVS